MNKKISLFSLGLLVVAAIDSIRNFPSAALFGSQLIFFFTISAILFLIPVALVSAELSATFPEKGGVYNWVRTAFGEKWAMVAIWLQWINTMVWYPAMLSFIAGIAAYLINPDLVQNKAYLVSCILITFWTLTLINLRGLHVSARVNSVCGLIGTIFPMLFLIALGAAWVIGGHPLQIHLDARSMIPSFSSWEGWVSLIAIMASFLGMELSGVHVNDVENPQKNFPKAILLSAAFILVSMMLGSLSIAAVIPVQEINLVSGVMQVFTDFFDIFCLAPLIPVLALLIVVGSVGGMINWLISPAKGLLHAAEFGFLPPLFTRKNRHGVAQNILLGQAILVSIFCLVFLLVPGVNAFYWFLTALSTQLYMMMYMLMFLAGLRLHHKYTNRPKVFKIPGNDVGMWSICLLGLLGCLATVAVGFLPPEHVDVGGPVHYASMIAIGNLLALAPLVLFFLHKRYYRAA